MSFTFNGINCESFGMYVERYPSRVFPQRKCTTYSIAGRSGDLIVDEDAYFNVTLPYEVYVKGGTAGLQSRLTQIAAWLLGNAGYADLTDTYDPTVYHRARVANAVEFLNSLNEFGKATIEFDCEPQRYPVTDELLTKAFTDTAQTVTYPNVAGLVPAYPVIEITGAILGAKPTITVTPAGDFLPSLTIAIDSTGYTDIVIDFATQSVYDKLSNQMPTNTTITGKWTKLGTGDKVTGRNTGNTASMTMNVYTKRYTI